MQPGPNNQWGKKGRLFLTLLLGAALFGSASAFAGVDASGAGAAEASAQTTIESAVQADVTPPDASAHVEAAMDAAMTVAMTAEAQAEMLLAEKDNLQAGGDAKWGVHGDGDGKYEASAGGDGDLGLDGTAEGKVEKGVDQQVDVSGAGDVGNSIIAQLEAGVNGFIGLVNEATAQLHGSLDLSLDAAASAIGSVGADIGGLFSLHDTAKAVDTGYLGLDKHVDWDLRQNVPAAELPRVDVPDIALNAGGQAAADAAAVANAAIGG